MTAKCMIQTMRRFTRQLLAHMRRGQLTFPNTLQFSPEIAIFAPSDAVCDVVPQTTLVPHITLKPWVPLAPQTTELPQSTDVPLRKTLVPQTTEVPHTTEVSQTALGSDTKDTVLLAGL